MVLFSWPFERARPFFFFFFFLPPLAFLAYWLLQLPVRVVYDAEGNPRELTTVLFYGSQVPSWFASSLPQSSFVCFIYNVQEF